MPLHADHVLAVTGSTSPVAVEWLPVDDLARRRPAGQDFAELGAGGRYCRRGHAAHPGDWQEARLELAGLARTDQPVGGQ